MNDRMTRSQRLEAQNVAEREIMRFADDRVLWFKHVLGIDIDPIQAVKMDLMDEHQFTVDYSCRRTRKTSAKELYNLFKLATEPDHELNIVAPRVDQAKDNIKYHLDGIRNSPILSAYIDYENGRRQIGQQNYRFANRSAARAFGIMSKLDGLNTTIADVEEADDLPDDRLWNIYMPTLGGTEQLFAKNRENKHPPVARFTGVLKGNELLAKLTRNPKFHLLPIVDVHLGLEMGLLARDWYDLQKQEMPRDDYLRQLCCVITESRNFIWERYIRAAMKRGGIMQGLEPTVIDPLGHFEPLGVDSVVCFGWDAGGHGESDHASRYALEVVEHFRGKTYWRYGREWEAVTNPEIMARDLIELWRFFEPKIAIGDAFGHHVLAYVCDELFRQNLTRFNRQAGDSSQSTWIDWPFSPVRPDGFTKHQAFMAVQREVHAGRYFAPMIDDSTKDKEEYKALKQLHRQLLNIRSERTGKTYNKYVMIDSKLGDDSADALSLAFYGLETRGLLIVPTVIVTTSRTRESILNPGDRLDPPPPRPKKDSRPDIPVGQSVGQPIEQKEKAVA